VIGVGLVGEDDIEAMMLKALSDKSGAIAATLRDQPCSR
jgi:hypothetical protein